MVINEGKKWNTVPKLWLEGVCEKLIEEGYTLNDDGTVSKAEA
jgi:hypothetical protein